MSEDIVKDQNALDYKLFQNDPKKFYREIQKETIYVKKKHDWRFKTFWSNIGYHEKSHIKKDLCIEQESHL